MNRPADWQGKYERSADSHARLNMVLDVDGRRRKDRRQVLGHVGMLNGLCEAASFRRAMLDGRFGPTTCMGFACFSRRYAARRFRRNEGDDRYHREDGVYPPIKGSG